MKYARIENERRLLLDALPDLPWERTLRITDRYVRGTRLRLRLVDEEGAAPVRKLGQKIPLDSVSSNAHTTLYLDDAEYALLEALPAAVLTKTRRLYGGWAVDVHASGLVVAETEGTTEPPFAGRDVTDDPRYTGGVLAGVTT